MRSNPQSPVQSSLRLQNVGQSAAKNSFSSSTYLKNYKCVVNSEQEQNNLKSNLSWRQATSMPIIKVISYAPEIQKHSEAAFPKIYNVELETIRKNINDLKNIDIGEALYLIRQYLLGIQTLSMKFNNEFDASKGFYGINNNGEAKVWVSNNFIKTENEKNSVVFSFSSNSGYSKLEDVLIFLFNMIENGLKHTMKPIFKEIQQKILTKNLTYSDVHSKLKKICSEMKITLPNCLYSYVPQAKKNQYRAQNSNKYSQQKKSKRSIAKNNFNNFMVSKNQINTMRYIPAKNRNQVQFKYNSPSHFQHCSAYTSAKKFDIQACSSKKPKVNFIYTNSAKKNDIQFAQHQQRPQTQAYIGQRPIKPFQPFQSAYDDPSRNPSKTSTANNSINRKQFPLRKAATLDEQLHECRSVPNNKLNRNLNSENKNLISAPFQTSRDQISIKQFNPLMEQDNPIETLKLKSLKTFHPKIVEQSFIQTLQSRVEQKSKITMNGSSMILESLNFCKQSMATTQFSHHTDRGIKNSLQEFQQKCIKTKLTDMIDNDKPTMNSILLPTPGQSRRNAQASRTTYNFGGLIPMDIKIVRQSEEISGKDVESLSASRDQNQINAESYQVKVSPQKDHSFKKYGQQTKQNFKIDFDVLCGVNIMAKFFNEDFKDLKQSVWCGQQKKAEHLHIKLQKLGKFGRQIKQSYVPQ